MKILRWISRFPGLLWTAILALGLAALAGGRFAAKLARKREAKEEFRSSVADTKRIYRQAVRSTKAAVEATDGDREWKQEQARIDAEKLKRKLLKDLGLGGVILVLTLALGASVRAEADPIKDCPVGLVCFTYEQVMEMDKQVLAMRRELTIAQAKVARLGSCIGPGTGVEFRLEDGEMGFDPVIGAFYVWGLRLPW